MNVFDLHCDTVSACLEQGKSLYENDLQLDVQRGLSFEQWVQTFAFWIDDRYRGENAWNHFLTQYAFWAQEALKNRQAVTFLSDSHRVIPHHCNALLSIEGGAALGGCLERIKEIKKMGISFLTLTWNGSNELGSGVSGTGGLTSLGREAVKELERQNVIVDVSHLNEEGFWDVAQIAEKPFIATHSNYRVLQEHPRNLKKEQVLELIQRQGLIGINFYPMFVTGGQDCRIEDIIRHIDGILSLGGEQVLSLGSDFDGARMPRDLSGIKGLEKLYQSMIKYFGKETTNCIFFDNAMRFVSENIRFPHQILK